MITQTKRSLSRGVAWRLHITEEIAVRTEDHHILVALEAVFIRTQATDKGIEIRILAEGIGNLITGNLLRDHNGSDMVDQNVDGCVVNTWTNNLFLTAYPDCLQ